MHDMVVKNWFDFLYIFIFIFLVFSSPFVSVLTPNKSWSEIEKRSLSTLPSLPQDISQMKKYFEQMDTYLADHFGFREFYIYRYQRELDKRFHKTSRNSLVLQGLDGWYFLNEPELVNDFLGLHVMKAPQIQKWIAGHNEIASWLEQRGIQYILAIPPNKQSIYPQYLMKHAMAMKGTSRFEQIEQHLDGLLPPFMINIHAVFRTKSNSEQLYFRNDSHWNKKGAYYYYLEIVNQLEKYFPDEEFKKDFTFITDETGPGGNTGRGGDLTYMLMKTDSVEIYPQIEQFDRCAKPAKTRYKLTNIPQEPGRISFAKACNKKPLRAVVFRDSFFVAVEPFLSENFGEVAYLWKDFSKENIKEIEAYYKPDVVINSVIERNAFSETRD